MIKRVDHVAVVVRNMDEALQLYDNLLGLKPGKVEDNQEQGVKAALISIGDTEIELLEPIDPNGGVAKFLEQRGGGLHHISLEVDDVDWQLEQLEAKGAKLIDKKGRSGLAGKIAFVHPKSLDGVLLELVQKV
jgi:methylmalonyl-CoA epimerase